MPISQQIPEEMTGFGLLMKLLAVSLPHTPHTSQAMEAMDQLSLQLADRY